MTKIKICGLTREGDAVLCADRGADFLGFIFVESSPRFIEPERAATIAERLRERDTSPKLVGVFRDASVEYMKEIVSLVGLDYVQLHGSETDGDIQAVGVPVVKTYRVGDELPDTTEHDSAEWVLFDTYDERRIGGTGRRFDWSLLSMYPRTKPFFLSGGINADNVAAAISLVRPDGIDIASGVESEPGVKDRVKIDALFERMRRT
jgi:phosphoribosylanthranilate isomerase